MRVLRLGVATGLVVALAACGGNGDPVGAGSAASTATSAPSTAASAPSTAASPPSTAASPPSTAASAPSTAASAAGGGAAKVLTALVGEPGNPDAFTVSLKDASGAPVTTLPAGEYQIKVSDQSKIHDLHLTGAGVDQTTSVPGTANVTWTVTLTPGTYTALCDPHPKKMKVEFTVT